MPLNEVVVSNQGLGVPFIGSALAWYPLQTRYQCEKRVDEALRAQGFECFSPMHNEMRRWSDRMKLVEIPLFPGYIFVRMEVKPRSVVRVLNVPGLVRFVTCGREFAVVPDREIEGIRAVLQNNTQFEACPFPAVGEKVRIRGGCLEGVEGTLVSHSDRGQLVISVGAIQRSLKIPIGGFQIERVF